MNCSCRGDTFALLFVIINEILENLMEKTNYYNLPYKAVKELLHTDTVQGLTEHEAMERLKEYGYNEFKKREHTTLWQKFVAQFKSFMISFGMSSAIGILSFVSQDWAARIRLQQILQELFLLMYLQAS